MFPIIIPLLCNLKLEAIFRPTKYRYIPPPISAKYIQKGLLNIRSIPDNGNVQSVIESQKAEPCISKKIGLINFCFRFYNIDIHRYFWKKSIIICPIQTFKDVLVSIIPQIKFISLSLFVFRF